MGRGLEPILTKYEGLAGHDARGALSFVRYPPTFEAGNGWLQRNHGKLGDPAGPGRKCNSGDGSAVGFGLERQP